MKKQKTKNKRCNSFFSLILALLICPCLSSCEVLYYTLLGAFYLLDSAYYTAPSQYQPTSNIYSGGYSSGSSNSFGSSSESSSSSSSKSSTDLCLNCGGLGKCPQCHGSGCRTDNMFGTGTDYSKKCGICSGSGKCQKCGGAGRVSH